MITLKVEHILRLCICFLIVISNSDQPRVILIELRYNRPMTQPEFTNLNLFKNSVKSKICNKVYWSCVRPHFNVIFNFYIFVRERVRFVLLRKLWDKHASSWIEALDQIVVIWLEYTTISGYFREKRNIPRIIFQRRL